MYLGSVHGTVRSCGTAFPPAGLQRATWPQALDRFEVRGGLRFNACRSRPITTVPELSDLRPQCRSCRSCRARRTAVAAEFAELSQSSHSHTRQRSLTFSTLRIPTAADLLYAAGSYHHARLRLLLNL